MLLMNWRCLAPIPLHFNGSLGKGTFIKTPFINGLHEITLIFYL
jgi:hypothetical protein